MGESITVFFNISSDRATAPQKPHQPFSFFRPPVAGIKVDDETALSFSAYWACMKVVSETFAYLPWHVYERGTKSTPYSGHLLDDKLYRMPNTELNSFVYKELLARHVLGWGNHYCEIEKTRNGLSIANLWPIDPASCNPDRDSRGRVVYDCAQGSGSNLLLNADNVFHVRGPSRDGIRGYSVIEMAKESISLGLAAEAFGAGFLGNGGFPGLIISNDGTAKLDDDGVRNLKSTFNKAHKGARKSGKVEYLSKGLKAEPVGISPQDMQCIELMKFTILQMCRFFRIPPHKLADLEKAAHTNIEAQNIEFVTDSIMPLVGRAENEANFRLLSANDARKYYTKLNVMGILRGDSKARAEYFKVLYGMGVLSIDEIRDFEDFDLLGGDVGNLRMVPVNMTTPERMISGQIADTGDRRAPASSFSSLFEEIAQRFCKIELKRAEALVKKSSEDEIVSFYVSHARACVDGFTRVSNVLCEQIGGNAEKIEPVLKQFFGDFCADSADHLRNAMITGKVPAVFASWEANKHSKLSRDLISRLVEQIK